MRVEKPYNLVTETAECIKDLCYIVGRSLPHARMERLAEGQQDNFVIDNKPQPKTLIQIARKAVRVTLLNNSMNKKQGVDSQKLEDIHSIDAILNKVEIDQHGLEVHKKYSTLAIIILTSILLLAVSNK